MGFPTGKQFEGCLAGCIMAAKDVHILTAESHGCAVPQGGPDFALKMKGCLRRHSVTTGSPQEEGRRGTEKGM